MSPKILRMRFFLLPTVAPTEVPVASDFFAMEGIASSLCGRGGSPRRKIRAACGSAPSRRRKRRRHTKPLPGPELQHWRRVERTAHRFLPWPAPALGPALLEAVERRRDIGRRHAPVKPLSRAIAPPRHCAQGSRMSGNRSLFDDPHAFLETGRALVDKGMGSKALALIARLRAERP